MNNQERRVSGKKDGQSQMFQRGYIIYEQKKINFEIGGKEVLGDLKKVSFREQGNKAVHVDYLILWAVTCPLVAELHA